MFLELLFVTMCVVGVISIGVGIYLLIHMFFETNEEWYKRVLFVLGMIFFTVLIIGSIYEGSLT